MKALLYCTKEKPYLVHMIEDDGVDYYDFGFKTFNYLEIPEISFNGKIVAEVEIDNVGQIWCMPCEEGNRYDCLFLPEEELCLQSCLNHYELHNYLKDNNGYALHLTNLKVFDKPYNLNEWFNKEEKELTKAPQNMCYCYHWLGDKYVLISIQPQHLCNILNGKKTIEVRRKVINCLKEMI